MQDTFHICVDVYLYPLFYHVILYLMYLYGWCDLYCVVMQCLAVPNNNSFVAGTRDATYGQSANISMAMLLRNTSASVVIGAIHTAEGMSNVNSYFEVGLIHIYIYIYVHYMCVILCVFVSLSSFFFVSCFFYYVLSRIFQFTGNIHINTPL